MGFTVVRDDCLRIVNGFHCAKVLTGLPLLQLQMLLMLLMRLGHWVSCRYMQACPIW